MMYSASLGDSRLSLAATSAKEILEYAREILQRKDIFVFSIPLPPLFAVLPLGFLDQLVLPKEVTLFQAGHGFPKEC